MAEEEEFDKITEGLDNETQVEGFQEGTVYAKIPQTPNEFRQHLENPELPAERQSAPAPEILNPHLRG